MGYVEAPRAWGLVRGMGRAVGLDLVAAVREGWLSRGDLGSLVETCESCEMAERCTAWLATHVQAETTPTFCRNGQELATLLP